MLHTKFQAYEPKVLNIFDISIVQTQDPFGGTVLDQGVSFCCTCFSKVRYRRPVFRPSVRPSFRSQFMSTLSFKIIKMTYSLKPLYSLIFNFICSIIRLQGFRMVKALSIVKMAADTKNSKTIKINFLSRGMTEVLYGTFVGPWFAVTSK